jgi:small-conductance mechanosensitive channel
VTLRALAWTVVIALQVSALAGYVAFASFLADQLVWVAFVIALLFLLTRLAQTGVAAGFRRESKVGRAVLVNAGLRAESLELIAILLSGFLTLALVIAAAMLALAPWGVESNDMLANFRAAFFGFKVGDVTVSLSSVVIAIAVFAVGWATARALQRWLDTSFLPHTHLDTGLRNSIATSIGYIGFVIALSLALSHLGLSFDKLAIVAGALSVGIGFGLQSIVSNFVSGLILLWERAIRVGDWVVMGDDQGYVRRINVRSTEIETFDRATMIVPNSNLVSGVVKNWVRNDRVGRIKNSVSVNIGCDPEKVKTALIACSHAHEGVLKDPEPYVNFVSLTDGALKFDLVCFVAEVEKSARIRSDLNFLIFKAFAEAGLDLMVTPIAPPLAMSGLERAEAMFASASPKG